MLPGQHLRGALVTLQVRPRILQCVIPQLPCPAPVMRHVPHQLTDHVPPVGVGNRRAHERKQVPSGKTCVL